MKILASLAILGVFGQGFDFGFWTAAVRQCMKQKNNFCLFCVVCHNEDFGQFGDFGSFLGRALKFVAIPCCLRRSWICTFWRFWVGP
jgi:hypothetical protein